MTIMRLESAQFLLIAQESCGTLSRNLFRSNVNSMLMVTKKVS